MGTKKEYKISITIFFGYMYVILTLFILLVNSLSVRKFKYTKFLVCLKFPPFSKFFQNRTFSATCSYTIIPSKYEL